jgi:hypothetical protein
VDGTHHTHIGAGIQSEMLRDTRHLVSRQHNAKSKEGMGLHGYKPHHEQGCLHEGGKTKSDDLFAPTAEPLTHSSRKAEKVKAAYGNLRKQDATSFDIREKALDYAVAKADNHQ